jgi:long-subunit fatty acid transport protein
LDALALRAGYIHRLNPVPQSTLTPLTAAIPQDTLTAGLGYNFGRWGLDFAYQYDLPARERVGTSALFSGEYSHSSTQVSGHWLALTFSLRF